MKTKNRPVRPGFVDLGSDSRPKSGKVYPVIEASSNKNGEID